MGRPLSRIMRDIRTEHEKSGGTEEWLEPFIIAQQKLEHDLLAKDIFEQLRVLEDILKITSENNVLKALILEFGDVFRERIGRNIESYKWSNIRKADSALQNDKGQRQPDIFQRLKDKYHQIAGAKQKAVHRISACEKRQKFVILIHRQSLPATATKVLTDLLNIKAVTIRKFLKGSLPVERPSELQPKMLKVGLPFLQGYLASLSASR